MFTENSKPQKRGRPPGRTPEGEAARAKLYATAIALIGERGYEETTLREVAARAGVSAGLLYRYFPSKRSIVLALYDDLSDRFARDADRLPPGKWRDRFMVALESSLSVLAPYRVALRALTPVMVGDVEEGVFAQSTAFSRMRVQGVFQRAIADAADAPPPKLADALARVLYLVHLGVLLWWLLDRSPQQRATNGLLALFRRILPPLSLTLRLPLVRGFVQAGDALLTDALLGPADSTGDTSRA